MSNTTLPAAVGARLEPGVGRLKPERAIPDGVVTVRTGGRRIKTYAVHFKGGEPAEVDVENSRPSCRPFWRLVWMKGDDKMGFAAAIAIRAALEKAGAAA